jgi:hypothetical protein
MIWSRCSFRITFISPACDLMVGLRFILVLRTEHNSRMPLCYPAATVPGEVDLHILVEAYITSQLCWDPMNGLLCVGFIWWNGIHVG